MTKSKVRVFSVIPLLVILVTFGTTARAEPSLEIIDAIRSALENNPEIFLQRETVEEGEGLYREQQGTFDTNLSLQTGYSKDHQPQSTLQSQNVGADTIRSTQSGYQAGLSQQLRTGQLVSLNASVQRDANQTFKTDKVNSGELSFNLTQPLLQGRGRKASAGAELNAYYEAEGRRLDLKRTVSEKVASTATAYWNYRAAERLLEIFEERENRARVRYEEATQLVDADEIPRSELDMALADLASRRADTINARSELFTAKQALGIEMGIPFGLITLLPSAGSPFPAPDSELLHLLDPGSNQLETLVGRRYDFRAAEKRVKASRAMLEVARNNRLPQLDLEMGAGYRSLNEGSQFQKYFGALSEQVSGTNVQVNLVYQFPVQNRQASGLYQQARAAERSSAITLHELGRQILSQGAIAISNLLNSHSEYQESKEAVSLYRKALQNETRKFQLSTSTLLDVQQVEENFLEAMQAKVTAQRNFAVALIELRFAVEDLIAFEQETGTIEPEILVTIPELVD